MAVKRCNASIDVVQAAENRIKNVFSNGVPVYLSFSGGKDSLVLAQLMASLIQRSEIRADFLTVQFVDEEAIFPCIEHTVLQWRKKFLMLGAKFEWYCVEVRHFNCFNELSEDESFICWDREKEAVWVRRPQPFAIRSHPLLRPRIDNYQSFMPRVCADGITLTGIRAAESLQRLQNMARMNMGACGMSARKQMFPVYDWSNADVWMYLKREGVTIPDIYLYLWQSGTRKNQLRVSQFFSTDTAKTLVTMNEYYPDLMERVVRREPNAYLASLYWDSEMFGRRTKTRKELEAGSAKKDYKAELVRMFSDMPRYFTTKHKMEIAMQYRRLYMKVAVFATERDYQDLYDGLMRGDPKLRAFRAIYQRIYTAYFDKAKAEVRHGC